MVDWRFNYWLNLLLLKEIAKAREVVAGLGYMFYVRLKEVGLIGGEYMQSTHKQKERMCVGPLYNLVIYLVYKSRNIADNLVNICFVYFDYASVFLSAIAMSNEMPYANIIFDKSVFVG